MKRNTYKFLHSLLESSSRFDYFTHVQNLDVSTKHTEFFSIANSSYLVLSIISDDTCVDSRLMKWNGTSFNNYQTIATASIAQTKFITTAWLDSYLLVLNNNDACSFGTSEYKSNSL